MGKKTAILKGFRDYLPEQMFARTAILDKVRVIFERFGFSPIDTPALEFAELLLKGDYGDEGETQLYRFTDKGGRDVCLRYDLTVPLARVVAMNPGLPLPFKRYHIGTAWRAEKPQRGRYREFLQCDVDIVGSAEPVADAECIRVDIELLRELGLGRRFRVLVNDRRVVNGLVSRLGLPPGGAKAAVFLRTLDKIHKIGMDGIEKILTGGDDPVLDAEGFTILGDYLAASDGPGEVIDHLAGIVSGSEEGRIGVNSLRNVAAFFTGSSGAAVPEFRIDPSIVRGLGYYTGTVFETFLDDLPELGSVMSGGRYDAMIGEFTGKPAPAVGISFGIDRLLAGLTELGLLKEKRTAARLLVTLFDADSVADAVKTAGFFRSRGIPTDLYAGGAKLSKQMKYAHRLGAPYVLIRGPEEVEADACTLRNMSTGEEERLSMDEAADRLSRETEE